MAVKNRHSTFVHLVNLGNPYFLYLRENPAVVLVSPPLTEGNFHKWKRDMIVEMINALLIILFQLLSQIATLSLVNE